MSDNDKLEIFYILAEKNDLDGHVKHKDRTCEKEVTMFESKCSLHESFTQPSHHFPLVCGDYISRLLVTHSSKVSYRDSQI